MWGENTFHGTYIIIFIDNTHETKENPLSSILCFFLLPPSESISIHSEALLVQQEEWKRERGESISIIGSSYTTVWTFRVCRHRTSALERVKRFSIPPSHLAG